MKALFFIVKLICLIVFAPIFAVLTGIFGFFTGMWTGAKSTFEWLKF